MNKFTPFFFCGFLLIGCSKKIVDAPPVANVSQVSPSSPPAKPPTVMVAGIEGFQLGQRLDANRKLEDGSGYSLITSYTKLPPFKELVVHADNDHLIRSVYLSTDVPEYCTQDAFDAVKNQLAGKYGKISEGSGSRLQQAEFGDTNRTILLTRCIEISSLSVEYRDEAFYNEKKKAVDAKIKREFSHL